MQVLPFSLPVLHISVMTSMNYSCICGCELKYRSSPQFLSLVETSKGFKQECLFGVLLARAFWQQCPRWRSASVRRESDRELKLRVCCMNKKW